MALVVFLRGVNVGGHRRFRPTELVKELSSFDVTNIGAAGTFIVRKPGSEAKFRAELLRKLPFAPEVMICDGRDLLPWATENPFGPDPPAAGTVRFVSVLAKPGAAVPALPAMWPAQDEWLVRALRFEKQFIFGEYRRHMKTIAYLGQLDKLFGAPVTTRNWNTILSVIRALNKPRRS